MQQRIMVMLVIVLLLAGCGDQKPAWEQRTMKNQQRIQPSVQENASNIPDVPQAEAPPTPLQSATAKPGKSLTVVLEQGKSQDFSDYHFLYTGGNATEIALEISGQQLVLTPGKAEQYNNQTIAAQFSDTTYAKIKVEIRQ